MSQVQYYPRYGSVEETEPKCAWVKQNGEGKTLECDCGTCSDEIAFKCIHCSVDVVRNTPAHEHCKTQNGEDWYCLDCSFNLDWNECEVCGCNMTEENTRYIEDGDTIIMCDECGDEDEEVECVECSTIVPSSEAELTGTEGWGICDNCLDEDDRLKNPMECEDCGDKENPIAKKVEDKWKINCPECWILNE